MLSTFYLKKEKKSHEDLVITTADLLYHNSRCVNVEQKLLESIYEKIRVEAVTIGLVTRAQKGLSQNEQSPEIELQFFTDDYGEEFVSKIFKSEFTNAEHSIGGRIKMVDVLPYKRYFGYFNQVKLSDTDDIPFLRIYSNNDVCITLHIEFSYVLKGVRTLNHKLDRVYETFKYGLANGNLELHKTYNMCSPDPSVVCREVIGFTNSMFDFGEGIIDPPKLSLNFNIMLNLEAKESGKMQTVKTLPCPILFNLVKNIHPYPPVCILKSDNIEEMPSENNFIDMLFNGLTIKDFQSGNIERHKGTYIFTGSIHRLPEHVAYNFQERGDNGEIITKQEIESSLYD